MSSIAVFLLKSRVHLVTDGAVCTADGTLVVPGTKVLPIPNLNAAIGFRGAYRDFFRLGTIASMQPDLAELRRDLPQAIRNLVELLASSSEPMELFDLVIAGVEGRKPFALLISNHTDRPFAPFEMVDIEYGWYSPAIHPAVIEKGRYLWQSDPLRAAAMTIQSQRELAEENCGIGVYGQLTTVTEEGVLSRVCCRWTDRAGKKMDKAARYIPS